MLRASACGTSGPGRLAVRLRDAVCASVRGLWGDLALTVTEVAQIVGTLLVLSLAITRRPLPSGCPPGRRSCLSVLFALLAADDGLVLSLQFPTVKASVFVTVLSFGTYLLARLGGSLREVRRPTALVAHPDGPPSPCRRRRCRTPRACD